MLLQTLFRAPFLFGAFIGAIVDLPSIIELDLKERTISLNIGLLRIANIPLLLAKELSREKTRLRRIVDKSVIRRRVMWESFERERADYLEESLATLEATLDLETEALGSSFRTSDEALASILRAWAQEASEARKSIRDAISAAKESEAEIDRDEWWEPHDDARLILAHFRAKVYPAALAIVEMLEASDTVRVKAEALIFEGRDRLVRFGISTSAVSAFGWSIDSR